jgi:predicted nuclease with TOPRIM domain
VVVDRGEHIAGLNLDRLNPADIDYFFRTLADRVPRRVADEQMSTLRTLRGRIQQLAVDLGKDTAASLDPADVEQTSGAVVDRIGQMKRKHWRGTLGDRRIIDHVRHQIGEISADLRDLGVS